MIKPPHPGETIKEDYLLPLGMSVNQLAKALGIGAARLNENVAASAASLPTPPCAWRSTSGSAPRPLQLFRRCYVDSRRWW